MTVQEEDDVILITDDGLPMEARHRIEEMGVKLIIA